MLSTFKWRRHINYYKFNIGDYAAATRHLTMLEHGAYRLLLDLCYTTEQPIPADMKATARKAGARSKDEVTAVEVVLNEFFTMSPGGWVHSRCDQEIAEYMEGSEERAKKEANEKERMRRHRERRSEMFEALRLVGIVPAWDVPMKDLQRLYSDKCNAPETSLQRVAGVAPETPATAKPLTTNQEPITNKEIPAHAPVFPARAEPPPDPPDDPESTAARLPTQAAAACIAMRANGLADCNPSHPNLMTLLAAGAGIDVFADAARCAVEKGKGFGYVLGIVKGRMADAATTAATQLSNPVSQTNRQQPAESFYERDQRLKAEDMAKWAPGIAKVPMNFANPFDGLTIDASEVRDVAAIGCR